jgi:hypothetical protein
MTDRAAIEVETLLKVILVLVVVWLALEIIGGFIRLVLGPLPEIIGLLVVVLIVLWLLDRL